MATIGRRAYAEIFGPTVGDRVRLADTGLLIEVEKDYTLAAGSYGEEVKFGGGKTIRDGMAQSQRTRLEGAVDCVLTNALILDHYSGPRLPRKTRASAHRLQLPVHATRKHPRSVVSQRCPIVAS